MKRRRGAMSTSRRERASEAREGLMREVMKLIVASLGF
jgi:hypothetical protein